MKRFLLLLGLVALTGTTRAQSVIDWFTLDAGGGAQASASYTVNSTAGQTEVGATTAPGSAHYRIVPGFWALENLGPATGRPPLSIQLSGANVILSWPSPSTGFVLEQTDSLDSLPASWSNTPGVVSDNGILKSIAIAHNVSRRFYRLRNGP